MTTRHLPAAQAPDSETHHGRALPWLSIGFALSAMCTCGAVCAVVSAKPGASWLANAKAGSASQAFGAGAASADQLDRPAKFLAGIGGQTFTSGARQDAAAEAELLKIGPNIAPVAWDRLPAGDCITVTTKTGQSFSFQILGARPAGKPEQADGAAKIELAVSGCADKGEPIAKAVIQPTNPPAPKAENAARTL